MRRPSFSLLSLIPLAALGLGCAEGGDKEFPQSEVLISASHHIWILSTLQELTFPLDPKDTIARNGSFILQSDSKYLVNIGGSTGTDDYALASSGELSVIVTPNPRSGRVSYVGAYGLEGDTGVYFFTDRFLSSSSSGLQLFWGTRVAAGTADVEGDWHVFSQHLIHSSSLLFTPDNVGRAVAGTLTIDSAGDITGQGTESTQANIQFSGTAIAVQDNRINLNLDYTDPQTSDTRLFLCSAGTPTGQATPRVILGLDEDTSDGEAGLIALLAKRTDPADPAKLAGTYLVGLHTIFVDPQNPGTDVGAGTLAFGDTGGFELLAQGGGGVAFSYTGTYMLDDDGTLTLAVAGTNETWMGAVDQDYQTIVIADNFVEARAGAKPPELNLLLALRQVEEEEPEPEE